MVQRYFVFEVAISPSSFSRPSSAWAEVGQPWTASWECSFCAGCAVKNWQSRFAGVFADWPWRTRRGSDVCTNGLYRWGTVVCSMARFRVRLVAVGRAGADSPVARRGFRQQEGTMNSKLSHESV